MSGCEGTMMNRVSTSNFNFLVVFIRYTEHFLPILSCSRSCFRINMSAADIGLCFFLWAQAIGT